MEPVVIQQALFGYFRGHGLISSSMPLSAQASRILQTNTDLAAIPGFEDRPSNSYISGFNLDENLYALTRTWPAFEQQRPGCVWSHVLLIRHGDIDPRWSARDLDELFRRPRLDTQFAEEYSRPIRFMASVPRPYAEVPNRTWDSVASAVYSSDEPMVLLADFLPDLDQAFLSIWLEQWPFIGPGFAFTTAFMAPATRRGPVTFDVQVVNQTDRRASHYVMLHNIVNLKHAPQLPPSGAQPLSWLKNQFLSPNGTQRFYDFLTAYGEDVPKRRSNFLAMADICRVMYDSQPPRAVDTLVETLQRFPEVSQARKLKRHLITSLSTIELLSYLVTNSEFDDVDLPIFSILNILLTRDPKRVGQFLKNVSNRKSRWVEKLFEEIETSRDSRWLDVIDSMPEPIVRKLVDHRIYEEDFWQSLLKEPGLRTWRAVVPIALKQMAPGHILKAIGKSRNLDALVDLLDMVDGESLISLVKYWRTAGVHFEGWLGASHTVSGTATVKLCRLYINDRTHDLDILNDVVPFLDVGILRENQELVKALVNANHTRLDSYTQLSALLFLLIFDVDEASGSKIVSWTLEPVLNDYSLDSRPRFHRWLFDNARLRVSTAESSIEEMLLEFLSAGVLSNQWHAKSIVNCTKNAELFQKIISGLRPAKDRKRLLEQLHRYLITTRYNAKREIVENLMRPTKKKRAWRGPEAY